MESSSPSETSLVSEAMISSFQKLQSQLPAGKLEMSFTTPDGRQVLALKAQLDNAGAQAVVPPLDIRAVEVAPIRPQDY